ncbi:hypothetical protein D3C76_1408420 [compost metagenome]
MRQLFQSMSLPLACTLLWACSAPDTKSPVETPGRPESARTQFLEAGAATLQSKPPIDAINAYLDGFHFYNGQPFQPIANSEVYSSAIVRAPSGTAVVNRNLA